MKIETISESKCGARKQIVIHGKDGSKKVSRTVHLVHNGRQWMGLKGASDWTLTDYGKPIDTQYLVGF